MEQKEFELIEHEDVEFVKAFINRLIYRAPHMHRDFEVDLIISGFCQLNGKDLDMVLKEGDIIVFNPYTMHELQALGGSVKIISLQVSNQFFTNLGIKPFHFDSYDEERISKEDKSRLQTLIVEAVLSYLNKETLSSLDCYGKVSSLFVSLSKTMPFSFDSDSKKYVSDDTKRIITILKYLDEHFREKIKQEDVSKLLFISNVSFSRYFSDTFGCSFRDYISKLRFEYAVSLIETTTLDLIDISLESGFSDYKYMEKMFKKNYGCTPKQYKSSLKTTSKRDFVRTNEYIYSNEEALQELQDYIKSGKVSISA